MKLPQLLSTAFFITAFSSLAQAQMTADQVKMAMNKETNQLELAKKIYNKARPNYHSVATHTMDELLGYK